jgi:uncharacterized protein (DUF934 family)
VADSHPAGNEASDAARWWRAYVLAENDQVDELRESAARGDEHARRQLADWLGDRGRNEEAIEAIRPLADAGDDVADRRLAQWLAERDDLDELRQRADRGSYHASRELATRLAEHDRYDELRERASASGGDHALCKLAGWLAQRDMHRELRELAVSADPDRRQLILEAAGQPTRARSAGWMFCGCWPTWEASGAGLSWPGGWPRLAIWTSCASAPRAETNTPGIGWRKRLASRKVAQHQLARK